MAKLYKTKIAQADAEFDAFVALLQAECVRSYLEIGSQYGGSLYRAATALPKGSRIVSVDLPNVDHSTIMPLKECMVDLSIDYDTRLFFGDSTSPQIIANVRALGPYDCIFIDGNHTLPFVTKDWQNYGPMGRMVAFHDINWNKPVNRPRPGKEAIEVKKLWDEIKLCYRHTEIIDPKHHKGIGVIWRD